MYPLIVPCLSVLVSRFAVVYRFFFVRAPQLEVKCYPRVSHYLTTVALRTPLRMVKETEIPPPASRALDLQVLSFCPLLDTLSELSA